MRIKSFHTTQQRGDTIIEVLLSMAIVGLVLGSSFGIANRSLIIGQSAKERTTALKIAESQIELMKSFNNLDSVEFRNQVNSSNFCMLIIPPTRVISINDLMPAPECTNINEDGNDGLYTIYIKPPLLAMGSYEPYEIQVSWERFGASSNAVRDSLSLYYKLGDL